MRCLQLGWLLLLTPVLIGCHEERAIKFAKPILNPESEPSNLLSLPGKKPEKSDPASEQILSEMLLKHTQSEPRRIEALRRHTIKRKGQWNTPQGKINASMQVTADWPKYRAVYQIEGMAPHTWVFLGQAGWQHAPSQGITTLSPLPPDIYERTQPDCAAEWTAMLVPLTESSRIVGPAPEGVSGKAVQVWLPDFPPLVIEIDPKTGLLFRIRFEAKETGRVVARSLVVSNFKTVGGVQLPGNLEFFEGPLPLASWKDMEYDLSPKIDPTVFEKP